jgi:hypothetical protein
MQVLREIASVIVLLAVHGCAARAGQATRGDVAAAPAAAGVAPTASSNAEPVSGPQRVDAIPGALQRGDVAAAAAALERLRRAPAPAQPSAGVLVYYDATVHAYQGDYRGAARILYDHIAKVGPAARAAFDFHDAMIALRTADGDLTGALVECEEMVRAGTLGTWTSQDVDRMTLVKLKEHWHRAYLLRMIAQTLAGAERQAFVDYAEHARQDYVALAAPLDLRDSIAVLDAYFAFCDGDRAKMREAAGRVNRSDDDDVEDLYLAQLALEGAGDGEAAAAVRKRILGSPPVTVLTPVFQRWVRADDASPEQPRQFSPRYPAGARPPR